ncbi:hypothetical protein N7449_000760 [Penicillium cf. viridicatum]|uniref:Uncharacterized protein n=1 Tax=Penicillium cf. viridicatum TaxID=2972119 RepID=A0A9W9T8T4_9EURO|nr:hypothetical protein N7449_000760 [Penicillium cf. viridicatum]
MNLVDGVEVEGSAETLVSWERPSIKLVIMVVESILEKKKTWLDGCWKILKMIALSVLVENPLSSVLPLGSYSFDFCSCSQ